MTFRVLALLILSYVATDLGDASVPGIFSFASDQLFVDGVVRVKAAAHFAERADAPSDAPQPRWYATAPAVSTVATGPAPLYFASSRYRPPHPVGITAVGDRADGEPPA